jgi:hypothetical protein
MIIIYNNFKNRVNILEFTSKMDVLFGGERMKADGLKY